MRPARASALATMILAGLWAAAPGAGAAEPDGDRAGEQVPGQYIVVYRDSVTSVSGETDQRERREGFRSRLRYRSAVEGFAARLTPRQVAALRDDPEVAAVVADRVVRAVGSAPLAPGEPVPPAGIRRIEAATDTTARAASSVNVAVIDTGIDLGHPDLSAVSGKNCVASGLAQDDHGHGTHVAGTIAARNNGAGVVGVAPGTRLYAAKVLSSSGSGTTSQVICGIDWVTSTRTDADPSNDIAVANMSLGGVGSAIRTCATTTDPQHKAICNSTAAGVTYAVAAGNDGWDFDYASQPNTPAAYPEVLTVTAMTDSDGRPGSTGGSPACRTTEADDSPASFSNYALTSAGQAHTIAAPGTCVRSTWPAGGYNTISGTSMATPHVAGTIALCLGENGTGGPCTGLTPAQIVQKLRSDAQSYAAATPGYAFSGSPFSGSKYYGYLESVAASAPGGPPPPPPPPSAPTATTGSASAVTNSSATVSGTVNPKGQATTYRFEYGTTTSYGASTAETSAGAGSTDQGVSASLSGLSPGTTYHYRLVATNSTGTSAGLDATFTTTTRVTATPASTTVQTGTFRAGSAGNLAADDALFYEVNSNTSGTRTSAWYGTFTGVPSTVANLKVAYKGKNSRTCSQTVAILRPSDGAWVTLDSRNVGTTEVRVDLSPTGAGSSWRSSAGEIRVRVRCRTSSGSFFSSGNLLQISYDS